MAGEFLEAQNIYERHNRALQFSLASGAVVRILLVAHVNRLRCAEGSRCLAGESSAATACQSWSTTSGNASGATGVSIKIPIMILNPAGLLAKRSGKREIAVFASNSRGATLKMGSF